MNKKISDIINKTFSSEYFLDSGSLDITKNLTEQIVAFNSKYPNAESDFFANLRASFPDAQVENWTHFFNLDRCIKFLVQFNQKERYVCQLSIYGYFSVYHCPYTFDNGLYTYGKKLFINPQELVACDKMYRCAKVLEEGPEWLEKEVLMEIVFDFSIPKITHDYTIKVADVLFTEHYL